MRYFSMIIFRSRESVFSFMELKGKWARYS